MNISVYALRSKHHLPRSKITCPDFVVVNLKIMSSSCSSWQIYGLVESWSDFTASRSEILRCDIAFVHNLSWHFLTCPSGQVAEKSTCPPENQLVFGRADEC